MNLPGADDMYTQQFEALLAAGNIKGAAEIAARSPRGILRNAETIARFQKMPATPGQHPPVLQYVVFERESARILVTSLYEYHRITTHSRITICITR